MAKSHMSIEQTIAAIAKRRPVLEPILRGIAPLLQAREEAANGLVGLIPAMPAFQAEAARAGAPLLAGFSGRGADAAIRQAALKILPLLAAQPAIAPHMRALESLFRGDSDDDREGLLSAMLVGSPEKAARIAELHGTGLDVLNFAAEFIIAAVLRAMARQSGQGASPWDEEGAWRMGYCPVCGTYPSIAWLDKPQVDEKNAFLAGGGGKKHYYCPQCASTWKFRRSACPACEREGSATIEVMRESGTHGERVDFCVHCKTYVPTIDLRELFDMPHMDVMAPGMMHLEMVAAEKGLKPLRASFWNMN